MTNCTAKNPFNKVPGRPVVTEELKKVFLAASVQLCVHRGAEAGRRHLQALRRARVLAQLWGGEALERPELLVQPQQVHLIYGASKTVLHSQLVEQHTLSRHGHLLLLHLTVGEHLLHVHHQLEKRRRQTVHFCYVASESHAISSPTELVLLHNPSTKHHILWLQSRAYFDIQCLYQITIGLGVFNVLPGFDCLELNRDFE